MIAAAIHPIRPEDEADARSFLAQKPYENVYLEWLISQRRSMRDRLFCFRDSQRAVRGVAFYGRQTILAVTSSDALAAFAELAREFGDERMIVAQRDTALQFWVHVKSWHRAPRLVRDRQPLFVLRAAPQARGAGVAVRRARSSEVEEVARNSAAMIEQELEYDPRRAAGDFFENVNHMVRQGLWWVATSAGRLSFFCHVGPSSPHTVQLQGVWTPPELRRRGLATDALAQICRRLLERYPTVSLYVNDFNEAAIGLYRKVGFSETGTLATYVF